MTIPSDFDRDVLAWRRLFSAMVDGSATDEQRQDVNELLRQNPRAVDEYLAYVDLHAALSASSLVTAPLSGPALSPAAVRRSSKIKLGFVAVIASLFVAATATFALLSRWADQPGGALPVSQSAAPSRPEPIAVVTSVAMPGAASFRLGQAFYPDDRITLEAGSLSLRFTLGVNVDLVGPVDLELESAKRAILHRGRLTADVEPSAHGFRIVTPYADIIDQGTKFGVNVEESGHADAIVFEGGIDIVSAVRNTVSPIDRYDRLRAGEAAHIVDSKDFRRIPLVRVEETSTDWSTNNEQAQSTFIASVSDNFPSDEVAPASRSVYYGLVPGGFGEGARCYVDRPCEWNSLPGVPFPEPLRGGDCIRLMNDLRFVMNLEVKIGLRQPADVYVLMDQRVPPPAWLVRDFARTTMTIGVNEYGSRGFDESKLPANDGIQGASPGETVDRAFDIWVQHCETAGDVVLGSLVEHTAESPSLPKLPVTIYALSMYGVVVTAPSQSVEASVVTPLESSP